MKVFNFQGKTEKEKAKDKSKSGDKNKFKDKMPKILKAGESGGKGKKKVIYFKRKTNLKNNLEMVKD